MKKIGLCYSTYNSKINTRFLLQILISEIKTNFKKNLAIDFSSWSTSELSRNHISIQRQI